MTDAAFRYGQLEQLILRGRALQTLPEDEEDALLEQMDILWLRMAPAERDACNERAEVMLSIQAPTSLDYLDRNVRRGSKSSPRKVA